MDFIQLNIFDNQLTDHNDQRNQFYDKPGKEHYRLLAHLSTQYNDSIIIDIGTHMGSSALALSYNRSNHVHSFDITTNHNITSDNITFYTENLWDYTILSKRRSLLLNSKIILLDIDPHEGKLEYIFYKWLKSNNYQGILVCDDIWYFKNMRDNFWYKIPSEFKTDMSHLGHWSGTGIIKFNEEFKVDSHWTIVTAYFDLTKEPDASESIKNRPLQHYLNSCETTMAIDQNLVIFCDASSRDLLLSKRPEHLKHKTKIYVLTFNEIELVKNNFEKITLDRQKRNYNADPRNTVSYYLFCMCRYFFLQETIKENPFGSTHFAWCNICIERMSWQCGRYLPEIWKTNRDKFSTCYIDYQSRSWLSRLHEYYQFGRCSMCSGFFTGNAHYMSIFCEKIMVMFNKMYLLGLGHADEQLFTLVYFENPDLFEVYYGDYFEMIINYCKITECPEKVIYNFMRSLYRCINQHPEDAIESNYKLLLDVTNRWLNEVNQENYEVIKYNIFAKGKLI
jgi:hypothetical protein